MNFFDAAPLTPKVFTFACGLVLPHRVKQAAKRQAKQCTALFCATPTHCLNLTHRIV
jgi:hypothetical protein